MRRLVRSEGSAARLARDAKAVRTEARITGLSEFLSRGDQSDYIRQTLADLETQAKAEKNAIRALKQQAAKPIRLPPRRSS